MSRYRRKSFEVDAQRVQSPQMVLTTDGHKYAKRGDWLVTETNGDTHLCEADIFRDEVRADHPAPPQPRRRRIMSSLFDEALKLTTSANLSLDGEFAEAVTYRPRTGSDRSIYATVTRNPPATPDELQRGITPSLMVEVRNDSTYGIALSELDTGGDALVLKIRLGGADAAEAVMLPEPAAQDAASILFRIGKRK
jgi:hypothetical protein